jgi:TP901 family phage tail tape measure protein
MAANELRLRFILDALDRVSGPMKDIVGGTSRAAKALKATRTELEALQNQQKQISAYQRQQASLTEQTAKLAEARQRQQALATQMEATAAPTKKLQNLYAKTGREVQTLEGLTKRQAEGLNDLAGEMKAAGIEVGALSHHEQILADRIRQTSLRLSEQQGRLDRAAAARRRYDARTGLAQRMAIGGAATLATGVTAAAPMYEAVVSAREYESVMTDIAQKSDMSRAAAKKLGGELRIVAKNTNQFSEDIQRGMDVLTGKGLDAATAAKMMAPIGKAATAYKAEMGDLSAAGFAVFDNLKVPLTEVGKALDIMAAGGKAGSFELKDMARYFPALTAGYTALGQKGVGAVADLTAALEIATKGAGSADEAANNVVNLITKLNSREVTQNFAKFGVDLPKALKKAYAEGKTPIEAIAELTQKALGGKMDKLSYLFSDMQVQAALRPILQNMVEYRKIRGEALSATGTVEKDFAERMQDAAEKAKANDIALKNLALSVGALLLPTVTVLAEKLTAVANKFADWSERHPKLAKALVMVAAAGAALLVTLGGIGIASGALINGWAAMVFVLSKLGPLLGLASGGLRLIAVGIRIVGAAVMANPILAAIIAIATAVYLIYRNWDTIGPWLANLWAKIKTFFADGVAFLTQRVPAMMAGIGSNIVQGIWSGIEGAKAWLIGKLTAFAQLIPAPIRKALSIHSPSRVFADIGGYMMSGLAQGIEAGTGAPLSRVGDLSARLTRAIAVGAAVAGPVSLPAAAAPDAARATAPASGDSQVRHYSITINANGAAAPDIARAVREEIARIEREKAGRAYKDE